MEFSSDRTVELLGLKMDGI